MTFKPFDVSIPHIVYAALGGFIVLFGMFSLLIRERLYIGEACLAFVFGIIIGPYGANIFDPRGWGGGSEVVVNQITLEVTRVILAVGVFAIGVELPKAYMKNHWKSLAFLLFPVMTWGWLVSAGLIFALIPGLNFLSSLAVAACLTPTDPILAAAVVGGKYADKHVPAHLRHLLAAESGCNDGAAFPFLYLALYLVIDASDAQAVEDWFLVTWLYEVILGVVFGSAIGWAFRHIMKFCERKDLIDRQSYVAQYVSLAMFTIGVTTMLGSDDLLAAFACGTAFAWDGFFNRQTEQSVFSSVIDLLFNIAAFVFIGAWMPFSSFSNEALTLSVWRLIVIAILVLLLRRLPVILMLYKWIPDVKTFREAVFSGHFGPMGVGAVFISTLATQKLAGSVEGGGSQLALLASSIQPIVAFMVLCSITIHGLSIPFFSLGRRVHSVSRTWSRHQSIDPSAPEWSTHTRRVTRPEDVVINRDVVNKESAMERGELSPDEKNGKLEGEGNGAVKGPSETGSALSGVTPTQEEGASTAVETEGARPDSPPDGEAGTAEWQEGNDLVIEKRSGPGEEVEVEVVHNGAPAGDRSEKPRFSSTFRGPAADVEHAVKHHVHGWRGATRRVEKEAEERAHRVKDEIGDVVHAVEDEARHVLHRPVQPHEQPVSDDEEGWASDWSGPSENEQRRASSSAADNGRAAKRSKSPKHKPAQHSSVPRPTSTRRRHSVRRAILGRSHVQRASPSPTPSLGSVVDSSAEGEEERGRPASVGTSPGGGTGHHALQNRRIDSLRSPMSRSASPARSIRFADDEKHSGTSTPRTDDRELLPQSPTRVVFDLPRGSRS